MTQTIFFQGADAKARQWSEYLSNAPHPIVTLYDHFEVLRRSRKGDLIIYRYQNNDRRLHVAILETTLLLASLLKARVQNISVVWICHNVDQDTSPYHKWLERLRRSALARVANCVMVLDPAFVPHAPGNHICTISFGAKNGGEISHKTLETITSFSTEHDLIILIAGQDGLKYRSFARIPQLHSMLSERFGRVGFIVAGMSADRQFDADIETDVLRISVPNLDECALTGIVDFIYRENDDISMPYTLYAAATAGIPLLTRRGNILDTIITREELGLCADAVHPDTPRPSAEAYRKFLDKHRWDSLARILSEEGLIH